MGREIPGIIKLMRERVLTYYKYVSQKRGREGCGAVFKGGATLNGEKVSFFNNSSIQGVPSSFIILKLRTLGRGTVKFRL